MNISKTAVSIFLVFISTITGAQDINFEDLHKAGPGLVKFATITGLASDADSYTKSFTDTDSSRREASRQASSSYSSSSGSSGSNSGAPWTVVSSNAISRHGWVRESRVKCLKGPSYKIGSEHTIWTRNDGGVEVSVGFSSIRQNNFAKGANFACGIDN